MHSFLGKRVRTRLICQLHFLILNYVAKYLSLDNPSLHGVDVFCHPIVHAIILQYLQLVVGLRSMAFRILICEHYLLGWKVFTLQSMDSFF